MTSQRTGQRPPVPASRLYPMLEVRQDTPDLLAALLARLPLATVLLVPAPGAALKAEAVRPLVELAQKRNCAILLRDDAPLARTLRADGAHLSPTADLAARYDEARSILGRGAIVGVDVGASRHLAMELGEAGADYIAFSAEPEVTLPVSATATDDGDGDRDDLEAGLLGPATHAELVTWWAEVFEIPCVAVVTGDPERVADAAAAGADFIACRLAEAPAAIADQVALLLRLHDCARGTDAVET